MPRCGPATAQGRPNDPQRLGSSASRVLCLSREHEELHCASGFLVCKVFWAMRWAISQRTARLPFQNCLRIANVFGVGCARSYFANPRPTFVLTAASTHLRIVILSQSVTAASVVREALADGFRQPEFLTPTRGLLAETQMPAGTCTGRTARATSSREAGTTGASCR